MLPSKSSNSGNVSRIPFSGAASGNNQIVNSPTFDNSAESLYSQGIINGLSAPLQAQIKDFLNSSGIPQERKNAFLSSLGGLSSSLPSQSGLDSFSEMILGTSNYQRAMNQYGSQVGALLAQYLNTDYQEDYDTALSQAARERQAGVNPNIQGNTDPGSAADFDDQATNIQSPSSVYPDTSNFIPQLLSAVQGMFGFVSAFQGLIKNGVEIDAMQTANISSENDMVRDMVLSSGFVPDSAINIDFTQSYPDEYGNMVSFLDDKGRMIPFSKFTDMQRRALRNLVQANGLSNTQLIENLFKGSGFSSNKIARLKGRAFDYLSSERFLSDWYSNYQSHFANKLAGNKSSEDVMLNAFDNILGGFTSAISKHEYNRNSSLLKYEKESYDELVKQGVPDAEARMRSTQVARDMADNAIFDDLRQSLDETLDPKSDKGKNASGWDKFVARIGQLFLFYIRNKKF